MGMALTSCTVPAAGSPTFELGDDEIEMGVGIHGEPGRERMKMKQASEIVDMMATAIVDDLPFGKGDQVLAFVNGMGGTPMIELYVVYNELNKFLSGRDDLAEPDRLVHHLARDGRVLDHAAEAERRLHAAVDAP